MFSFNQWGESEMVDWTVPKKEEIPKSQRAAERAKAAIGRIAQEDEKILDELPPPSAAIGRITLPPLEKEIELTEKIKSNWTDEYPTEYGVTAFRRDKILGVTDTSKSILVHMVNGHTYTITIKESIIPFFNRDGLTTTDVLNDLKSD